MSLTVRPRGELRKFEILLENKHMNTDHTQQASTPDADICGELRTKSGQGINQGEQATGKLSMSVAFRSRDEAIERLCMKVFGAIPVYPDPVPPTPPAPAAMATPWEDRNAASLEIARLKNPPAERPTPITDADSVSELWKSLRQVDRVADLERQLAEARETINDVLNALGAIEHEGPRLAAMRVKGERDEAREQRDRLAVALEEIPSKARYVFTSQDGEIHRPVKDAIDYVQALANVTLDGLNNVDPITSLEKALAAVKETEQNA